MRKVLLQLFFMLTLLGSSLYSLCGEESQLQILPQEVQEVVTSSKTYLFIGEELTQIKSIIAQARALTEDAGTANSLDQLLSRYEQGFKTAPQELVVSALEEAESLIEKGHESFNDEQLGQISDSFAKCCKQIDDGELLISVNKNATRSPRDPQAPGGTPGLPAAEAGTLVPTNEPSKDLFVENDLTVGGNMDIHGDTHYAGNVEIDGTLTVGLATTLNSTLLVVGETTLTDTLYPITGIEAGPSGILNIGVTDDTDTLNLGTAAAVQAVNIGTGAGVTTINLGGAGDTVNVYGTTNYIQVDDLQVKDKNIIINKDGVAGSADLSGINIEEDGSITGYMRTNADRSGIELKAPAREGIVAIKPHLTTLGGDNFELTVEGERLITERDWEDIFVGRGAGNTTMTGTRNCGLGAGTLQSLTTGSGNVGIGHVALADVWSGSNNVCIGNECGNDITTGSSNIAIGYLALRTATTANFNTAIGASALQLADSYENSAFGASTLTTLSSGNQNTGIGNGALLSATTGSRNTALGYLAGSSQTTGSNNIYIGARQLGIGGEAGVIRIGVRDDLNASVSTDCYIEGITGQATAATANVALIDTNSKLGTSATTSATVNTPSFIINNNAGSATLNLQDSSVAPISWKLTAGTGATVDLDIIQDATTRFKANAQGLGMLNMDINGTDFKNGKAPMLEGSMAFCPRIIYGTITGWTSGDAAGTPVITAPGGWSATQSQAGAGANTQAVLTFDKPFTTVPFVSINMNSNTLVQIDNVTTSQIFFSGYALSGSFHDRWNFPAPRIMVIGY